MGKTVGSLNRTQTNDLFDKAAGGKPVVLVSVGNVPFNALLDTGSQVTTLSESFYKQHIESRSHHFYEGNIFKLSCANRLEIPCIHWDCST